MSDAPIVWTPPEGADSAMRRFMQARGFDDYGALWDWSVGELEDFWESVWRWFDLRSSTPYEAVLSSRSMPGARWFQGARLNYAEHALRHSGDVAVIGVGEEGPARELSWDELRLTVGGVAAALRDRGIGPGDVVAGYLPNGVEAVVAYLASATIGATWASCAPDLEPAAALERLAQLRPVVLIASGGYVFGGRYRDRRASSEELAGALDSLEHVIFVGDDAWDELTSQPTEPVFEQVPFDHPLYVLFSSGTTGAPKGIVHGHGGQLLDHVRHHGFHLDLGPEDRFFFFTTTNWMVWNWLVAGLLVGSAIVLYDGSPRHPELDAQFEVVARTGATVLGTSASYLTGCANAGLAPGERHDLSRLRAIASTGSPLPPETFHWIRDGVGAHVWPVSTSGGTDVCSAFVSGCPLKPVRAGEIQCRCLGAAVDVFDEEGRPIVGRLGELVITAPLPSMPVRFWNDPDGSRYRASYFEHFPGIWRHGDWATLTDEGSIVIHGRSDSTLNRHGIRIGTAELYAAVERIPQVADSMVVGIEQPDGGYWMPMFVALEEGVELDEQLKADILATIRSETSPRHVPDEVHQVPAIPRTLTGKKLEVPVKRILMGTDPEKVLNRNAVADPAALDELVALATSRAAEQHST